MGQLKFWQDQKGGFVTLPPSAYAPADFPFAERLVLLKLGLSKDEVRQLRHKHLREGDQWVLQKKRVWLSQSGVDALLAAVGQLPQKNGASAHSANPAAGDPLKNAPKETPLRVVKNNLLNRYLVLACPADQDPDRPTTVVRVKVSNRRAGEDMRVNLSRRMEIPARLVHAPDLYELARPMPRKKGQW